MNYIKTLIDALNHKERLRLLVATILFVTASIARITLAIQENSDFIPIGGGSFREGIIGQPIAVNPIITSNQTDQDISALVYSRLFDLMSDYEIQEDGRTYLIKLKEDLKWDNGQPLTTDDVIFTIKTVQDPEVKSPLSKSWQGVVVERLSELKIQLLLPAPYAFFTNNLKQLSVIPKHIFGKIPGENIRLSAYNLEPVGSGPYAFKDYSKRRDGFITQYHLKTNKYYHGQKPFIDDFYFKFYDNSRDLFDALARREINGFGTLNPLDANQKNWSSTRIKATNVAMPRYYAIFLNQNINPLLKNNDLRYALNVAIDRERIAREIFNNKSEVINSPLPKEYSRTNNNLTINYNPLEAQQRIQNLKNQNIELNLIVPKIDFLERTAKIIKENFETAGLKKINLYFLDQDELLDDVIKTNNYEMILFGNILENPIDLFSFWHSSQRFYPGLNLSLYQNTKVDTLIENIRQTEDKTKQLELLKNTEEIIMKDVPALFLFTLPYTYIHPKILSGTDFEKNYLVTPEDRFINVAKWSLMNARVIK